LLQLSAAVPELFWLPEIPVQELISPILTANERLFRDLVEALRWADRLAGNRLAEGYDYALRLGATSAPLDRNEEMRIEINRTRRKFIKIEKVSDITVEMRRSATFLRDATNGQRSKWVERCTKMVAEMKILLAPHLEKPTGREIVDSILRVSGEVMEDIARRHRDEHGEQRAVEEIRHSLREFFHFEAAAIEKALAPNGYNFEKNRNDFHDWILCAYPAAGYSVVTGDKRLLRALEGAQCPSPRVVDVAAGIHIAEEWLANRALNLTGAVAPAG
jgi:hypothetical protein